MKYIVTSFTLAALVLAGPVPDVASPSPPSYKIISAIHGGNGCPQGSIDLEFTDSRLLPIYFGNDFMATLGPNTSDNIKNCQVSLDIVFSPGYQYTVFSADYSGWADLDSSVKASIRSKYYFAGYSGEAITVMDINGPFSGKFNKHDDVDLAVWSPCGSEGLLNFNTRAILTTTNTSANGMLAMAKESTKFTQNLYLKWRQC
ncbi:uncharacterized protein BDR25DRAFT_238543 [Lindgomyces ingoldianus]|uniref:Uncharacterized protein n=1 Tax=Lindgomyces ingoldianus TaxID=673940 RepID=A0ACB6QGB3_9PLEO|nr:uncharacterized protein BDR25DRAFT_238543 [Lindgomyces ingoldianus]KAF2466023.1 hypothetical protein BDR25DRAFT_238543 [Lindgomyces ingoldianus]